MRLHHGMHYSGISIIILPSTLFSKRPVLSTIIAAKQQHMSRPPFYILGTQGSNFADESQGNSQAVSLVTPGEALPGGSICKQLDNNSTTNLLEKKSHFSSTDSSMVESFLWKTIFQAPAPFCMQI